jgi:hypothetical protein
MISNKMACAEEEREKKKWSINSNTKDKHDSHPNDSRIFVG